VNIALRTFKRWLVAGEGDAILIVDADAPQVGLAFAPAAELFAAQARHGLQAGDGNRVIQKTQFAKGVLLNLGGNALDGLACQEVGSVLSGEVNDHG